jgi:hypothetical protein
MTQAWTAFIIITTAALLWKFSEFLDEHQKAKHERRKRARQEPKVPSDYFTKN